LIIPWQMPLDILKSVEYDPDLSDDHQSNFWLAAGKHLLQHSHRVVIERLLRVLFADIMLKLSDYSFELDDLVLLQSSLCIHLLKIVCF
jgi:hypothetical protein